MYEVIYSGIKIYQNGLKNIFIKLTEKENEETYRKHGGKLKL